MKKSLPPPTLLCVGFTNWKDEHILAQIVCNAAKCTCQVFRKSILIRSVLVSPCAEKLKRSQWANTCKLIVYASLVQNLGNFRGWKLFRCFKGETLLYISLLFYPFKKEILTKRISIMFCWIFNFSFSKVHLVKIPADLYQVISMHAINQTV